MSLESEELSELIAARLTDAQEKLRQQWAAWPWTRHFSLDHLLPAALGDELAAQFPPPHQLRRKLGPQEAKYVSSDLDSMPAGVAAALLAFQQPAVLEVIARITSLEGLEPDPRLYAGGISLMGRGDYLQPHIDNSHDQERRRYRVLNLLYYVSPDWDETMGGSLELWPAGLQRYPVVIPARFNRLVVMETHRHSIHSVNPIRVNRSRCCISNYYFSLQSPTGTPYYHSTSFWGRPGQPLRNAWLRFSARSRTWLRPRLDPLFRRGLLRNPHAYRPR